METYKLIVEFERDYEDDIEEAKANFPKLPIREALIRLFAMEMQSAYDECGLSGHFKVNGIDIKNSEVKT